LPLATEPEIRVATVQEIQLAQLALRQVSSAVHEMLQQHFPRGCVCQLGEVGKQRLDGQLLPALEECRRHFKRTHKSALLLHRRWHGYVEGFRLEPWRRAGDRRPRAADADQ